MIAPATPLVPMTIATMCAVFARVLAAPGEADGLAGGHADRGLLDDVLAAAVPPGHIRREDRTHDEAADDHRGTSAEAERGDEGTPRRPGG